MIQSNLGETESEGSYNPRTFLQLIASLILNRAIKFADGYSLSPNTTAQ